MQKETLKEYTRRFCDGCSNTQWDNSPATECGQCLEDFVEAIIRLCTPKPSDDMTVPMENPSKEYLMYEKGIGWVIGYYDPEFVEFICNDVSNDGEMFFIPSH